MRSLEWLNALAKQVLSQGLYLAAIRDEDRRTNTVPVLPVDGCACLKQRPQAERLAF
jgi:hypothetical protein